ncbi:hypothetical protein CIB48_g11064 [Xylaria polymorpha]|nr:hypothetical protein CIB48_g11064 [Xylaria polymorpha]
MKFTTQIGAVLALISSPAVDAWNATIYDSEYFEMKGSWGAEIACTFHGRNNSSGPCEEQFLVGKSVFSSVGPCRTYSGGHSSGAHIASQKQGECKTTDFDILSVVCYDE